MCLPALAEFRRRWPECRLTVLARPQVAEVFRAAGQDWEVRETERPQGWGWGALRAAGRQRAPKRERADFTLVLPNSWFSALYARRLGTRRRIGYARGGRGLLLRPAMARPRAGETGTHEAFYYWELLRRAGALGEAPAAPRARLVAAAEHVTHWRGQWEAKAATEEGAGPLRDRRVALHAGASYGTAKRWPPERFAAVAARMAEEGAVVAWVGARAERDLAETSRREATAALKTPAAAARLVNWAGKTSLADLLALLATSDLLISNDSGPMHLAGALGVPVAAIFGATNERETSPLAAPERLAIVKAAGVECSPCKLRECPIDHRCMTRVGVEEVTAAARLLLARRGAGT